MDIRVPCSHCGKVLFVNEASASRVGTCPHCHQNVVVGRPGAQGNSKRAADSSGSGPIRRSPRPGKKRSGSGSSSSGRFLTDIQTQVYTGLVPPAVDASTQETFRGLSSDSEPELKAQTLRTGVLPDPLVEDPDAVWYVRSPGGGQYGPASNEVMKTWIDEGRVGAQSFVWRAGWTDWLTAARVFHALPGAPTNPHKVSTPVSRAAEYLEKKKAQTQKPRLAPIWIGLSIAAALAGIALVFWMLS